MSGIYVHIPFCRSKCAYCDFYSTPRAAAQAPAVADAIAREWTMRHEEIPGPISTLYLGGGTPSAISDESLRHIISRLPQPQREFTMEVNPDDVTQPRAAAWRAMGINRVSMGAQSFIDAELQAVGRRHTAAQTLRAVEAFRTVGIDNISLDLIYGLPGQTLASWEESLDAITAIRPCHISAYALSYEPGTRLTAMLHAGRLAQASDTLIEQMYTALCRRLRTEGYVHYEISNFALPGRQARHNSSYWDGTPYLGLGPSAHSYDGKVRRINPSSIHRYLQAIESGRTAFDIAPEDDDNRFNDVLITALRTRSGLDLRMLEPLRLRQLMLDARQHIDAGRLTLTDNHLAVPERHWLLSDMILRDLVQV